MIPAQTRPDTVSHSRRWKVDKVIHVARQLFYDKICVNSEH